MSEWPVLTALIFFPVVACLALPFLRGEKTVRVFSLCVGFIEILLALPLFGFDLFYSGYQFQEKVTWVPQWGLHYHLGMDGISLLMVLLTVLLLPLCVLCSWTYISRRITEFHVSLMLMTSACVGVFVALDFVLFYIFWEAMLVPMFLLIAVWGGPDRKYASLKFFIYTLAGSTLLLVVMVAFYLEGGSFSIPELSTKPFSFTFQCWTFLAMAFAFAIKVPMFPFHTWLPAAHVEAPTAGSVLLASVLLKMGAYGFLRFCLPLAPDASLYFAPMMIAISVASILYGGFVALGQQDMKKLIAYSSVAHMGFVTLGIFLFSIRGLEGALMVMLNHGITTGALFMLVGCIYERSHSRQIRDNLGLGKYLPAYMGFFGLFALSSLGFPGTNSFVGELLVLIGVFTDKPWIGAAVVPGVLLGAAYMLRLGQKLAWGAPTLAGNWKDLNFREWGYFVPLAILVFYIGLSPGLTLKAMDPTLKRVLKEFHNRISMTAGIPVDAAKRIDMARESSRSPAAIRQ
ncbi:MAG: NADH-quinone oxidoreductase subunit M [Desulfatirhabdiaceae bacterium]